MKRKTIKNIIAVLACSTLLTACNAPERLANVGKAPDLSEIKSPTEASNYRPVTMPMPAPKSIERQPNSLWLAGSRSFFKDQRASQIGDILTLVIDIDDEAAISNTTTRTRTNSNGADINSLLGYATSATFADILPEGVDPSDLVDIATDLSNAGTGNIDREEEISLNVAAVVTQVLPNGNLVIHGRQEMRVNFEVRELEVAGIIRPEDIMSDNTINFNKMAEARIAYGGRGHITDVQQPRYGDQVLDIIMPF